MTWKVLKSADDYQAAVKRMIDIFHVEDAGPIRDELELLIVLIKDYDDRNHPIPNLDPTQVLVHRMREMGLKSKDLIPIIGSKGHVSAILAGKREITLKMAQKLCRFLQIPPDVFFRS